MVFNMHMLGLIDDVISCELRCLLLEGDKEDLIGFLLMLVHPEVLAAVVGPLVTVDDGHAANFIQGEADY